MRTKYISIALIAWVFLAAVSADVLPYSTVFISRHCARAPSASFTGGGPGMPSNRNDYVANPYPNFGVKPMMCTPRGVEIIKNQGVSLRGTFLPNTTFSFLADVDQRDIDTAETYRQAIGGNADHAKVRVVADLFSTMPKVCPYLDQSVAVEAEKNWIKALPRPEGYDNMVASLQKITGVGKVGPFANIKSGISKTGSWYGLENTVADIMENFHLEAGAGIEVAWNNLSPTSDQYFKLLALRSYEFKGAFSPEYSRRYVSNIMYRISKVLSDAAQAYPTKPTTEFLVGHDTDIITFGTVMNLLWNPAPYPVNSTTTSSSLRFDLFPASAIHHESPEVAARALSKGDQFVVQISYIYGTTATTNGNLFQVPAVGPHVDKKGRLPLSDFVQQLKAQIRPECTRDVNKSREYDASMLTAIRERLGHEPNALKGLFTDALERQK